MQKLVLYYPENHQRIPSWLAMYDVYITNELPTALPARYLSNPVAAPFSIRKGDIMPIQTCSDFFRVVYVSTLPFSISTYCIVL